MTCVSTLSRTPFAGSQAFLHAVRLRTSSFVGSNSPLILLKTCNSASFKKSGGSGAPLASALYGREEEYAVCNRDTAVGCMHRGLTAVADVERRRAPARMRIWGCTYAEAMWRMRIALEGAIVCCKRMSALRGAYFISFKLTVRHATVYVWNLVNAIGSRETSS